MLPSWVSTGMAICHASEAAWLQVRKAALLGGIIMASDLELEAWPYSVPQLCTRIRCDSGSDLFCVSMWVISLPLYGRETASGTAEEAGF